MSRHCLTPLREESGMGLVEVMVSALLTITIALAVFSSLDNASATSGLNKSRAIAAGLAQQDLERMRSLKIADVSNLRGPAVPTVVDGVAYQVTSRSDWLSDGSGAQSCSAADGDADYLKITSTVTWPEMQGRAPVSASSLVAPPTGSFGPGQGTLAVQISDRNGVGIPGLAVNVSGPQSFASETTNDAGCVLLGYLPLGTYTVSFSKPGYINPSGIQAVSEQVSVLGEAVNAKGFLYDRPGSLLVNVRQGAGTTASSNANFVTITNGKLPAGTMVFPISPAASTRTISNLFPFPDGYGVYSGDCTGADRLAYPGNEPLTPTAVRVGVVPPAGVSPAVQVAEPRLRVVVRYGTTSSSTALANASVTLQKTATGCSGPMPAQTTNTSGRLPDEYLPYGTYSVCARHPTNGRKATVTVANTGPNAIGTVNSSNQSVDVTVLILDSSSQNQTCP